MTWLKRFNPTPAFPAHTGPHKVGSVDIEIPASQLDSPSANPPPADLPTVAFRVFYPCREESDQKAVRWIPSPQREYISAYAKFLGANSAFAGVFSLLPQLLYYTAMPVHQNADILQPSTKSQRWPVMVFSHGLGGSRNAYSNICGSLASHGIVVVAPDHRDGSAPLSIHRIPEQKEKVKRVEYRPVAHKASTEVYEARDEQLRIRLWELGMIHDALLKIDEGKSLKNVADHAKQDSSNLLSMFSRLLNVHDPGAVTFAGHSFGACTMIQFVKSIYYRNEAPRESSSKPLFTPTEDSQIVRQITPANPVALLDLWCLPIQSPATAWLRARPMPCYDAPTGGSNLLSILSESFYKWSANYNATRDVVAKPSATQSKYPNQPGAHIFYPISSAHLSQSDFGVLFPWVTTKMFGAKEPERVLRLNTRAVLQVMRESGVDVAHTSVADMETDDGVVRAEGGAQDKMILERKKDVVRGWVNLGGDGEGVVGHGTEKVDMGPGEAMMEGEALGEFVKAEGK